MKVSLSLLWRRSLGLRSRAGARFWLLGIICAYALVALTYAWATPPLESSDEYKHYPFVQYVQNNWILPILDPEEPGLWLQEAAQPPLYYFLMALATAGIDTNDLSKLHVANRHAYVGDPNQIYNKNLILPQPERTAFPWRGAVLAIYLIRLASIGLGVLTLFITAQLGRRLFSTRISLLATALTAFNPMFLFISAAVNNDSLATLLGVAVSYSLVRLWQDQLSPRKNRWSYVTFGGLLGLGMLTKLSLGGMLVIAGIVLLWMSWKHQKWEFLFEGGTIILAMALLIPSWWFLRNWHQYGNFTGLNVFIEVQGVRDSPITWVNWVDEFGTFYRTFWGLFGGVNVAAPTWFYYLYNMMAILGGAGWIWRWYRERHLSFVSSGAWILLAWAVVLFAFLLRWNMIAPSFQGRLIFPSLSGLYLLWGAGLMYWLPSTWRSRVAILLGGFALVLAALLPWFVIRPAYAYPTPLTTIPAGAQMDPIYFYTSDREEIIALVGVDVPPGQTTVPGGKNGIDVTAYWQALTPLSRNYLSSVHLLGRAYDSVGQVDRFPAWGMIPTSRWQLGQVWRDPYRIWVRQDARAPSILRLAVSLMDPEAGTLLSAESSDGLPLPLVLVGQARLGAPTPSSFRPPVALPIGFTDGIRLKGYGPDKQSIAAGDQLPLILYWRAENTPSLNYTVFVHLLDSAGAYITGADGPPLDGDYPTTLWRAGDEIVDLHSLDVPADLEPGRYQIAIGLYDPSTTIRVPRADGGDVVLWQIDIQSK